MYLTQLIFIHITHWRQADDHEDNFEKSARPCQKERIWNSVRREKVNLFKLHYYFRLPHAHQCTFNNFFILFSIQINFSPIFQSFFFAFLNEKEQKKNYS